MPHTQLAIEGGHPVRTEPLPYGRQTVDESDIAAVAAALRDDWLTTGPMVDRFEAAMATFVGTEHAVAVCNGTAALHAAAFALDLRAGDEVIVPPITFPSSANCAVFQAARPVFADVDPETLLLDPSSVEARISPNTKAVVAVDFAGQPCDYPELRRVTEGHGLSLLADACHALGGALDGRPVGALAELSAFSLHPVKPMTTGEGGLVTTNDAAMAERMRRFRNHGITTDHRQRAELGSWFYEMSELGYNYRITDFQCALGLSQLAKLPGWITRRQAIARRYDAAFATFDTVEPLHVRPGASHGYHLYVIRLDLERLRVGRAEAFAALRAEGIGVNVHYIPVHLHPYYRNTFGTAPGDCPVAEAAYERILSLPIFPTMTDGDIDDVITAVEKVTSTYRR